jgi:hypothetical protein
MIRDGDDPESVSLGAAGALPMHRVLWHAWKAYTRRASDYQAVVLLTLLYFCVLGPTVLGARLVGLRLLDLDQRPRHSYWIARKPLSHSLAELERPF